MDKKDFIGFGATLSLRDGAQVKGKIRDVDPASQTLYLDDVNIHYVGPYKFRGSDILDLSMFHIETPRSLDSPTPTRPTLTNTANPSKSPDQQFSKTNLESTQFRPRTAPQQQRKKTGARKTPRKAQIPSDSEQWAHDDVENILKAPDFDFESNLELFDKQKVFNDIREFDDTDPQLRLVATNKRPKNLSNRENVIQDFTHTRYRLQSSKVIPQSENPQKVAETPRRSNSMSSITDNLGLQLTVSPRPRRRDIPRRKRREDDDAGPGCPDEEFDFQAASERFDKKRIFEDIARG
ncbi:Enhancer of mRNA-decapping protein 3 [Neolecta irregularis DAH-3]|uniref:Enhancer of mRNA-decapping protein 3 n=1 Tax=Neolecta irregularis (strain DAH-3) TaxID=1198029 RepID=A0A1U7LTL0_NEOID|nr:Enhancer of mRNA-decapping protein 3 [Neolecta irregularis DAH-3]|eukprot:OLL26006.1 Enhancer of mRNA-decapping protein 3 [Neolecta irregularis DAH-3]